MIDGNEKRAIKCDQHLLETFGAIRIFGKNSPDERGAARIRAEQFRIIRSEVPVSQVLTALVGFAPYHIVGWTSL